MERIPFAIINDIQPVHHELIHADILVALSFFKKTNILYLGEEAEESEDEEDEGKTFLIGF